MTLAAPMARAPLAALMVLALALAPTRSAAQELTGVAVGPEGDPLADVTVVLHRVGAGGSGAFIGTDTTDTDGGFRFALPSADSAIYFAALRYEDALYIGPAVATGSEPVHGYVLSVDPASEAGAVASALAGERPAPRAAGGQPLPARESRSDAGALVLLALLTLAAVAAFLFAAPRYRQLRTRDAVIELARAENSLAGEEGPADPAERARLQATRDRLRKQLAPRS